MVDGCPPGYSGIFEQTICKQAATALGLDSVDRLGPNNISSAYLGCYFNHGHAYFNTHPNPDATEHAEHAGQVCMCETGASTTQPTTTTAKRTTTTTTKPTTTMSTATTTSMTTTTTASTTSEASTTEAQPKCSDNWILGQEGMVDGCPPG